jgi:type III secretory pathway component EscR
MSKIIEEIRKREKELADLKKIAENESNRDLYIKPLTEYTDAEKSKWFDMMYKSALSDLEAKEDGDYNDDDSLLRFLPSFFPAWEAYMEILGRDSNVFWKYWNSL